MAGRWGGRSLSLESLELLPHGKHSVFRLRVWRCLGLDLSTGVRTQTHDLQFGVWEYRTYTYTPRIGSTPRAGPPPPRVGRSEGLQYAYIDPQNHPNRHFVAVPWSVWGTVQLLLRLPKPLQIPPDSRGVVVDPPRASGPPDCGDLRPAVGTTLDDPCIRISEGHPGPERIPITTLRTRGVYK